MVTCIQQKNAQLGYPLIKVMGSKVVCIAANYVPMPCFCLSINLSVCHAFIGEARKYNDRVRY
jgi:hypothetical protein